MCFPSMPTPKPPAAAPPPPEPVAETQDLLGVRRAEDMKNFGSSAPDLKVDRAAVPGGTNTGSGLKM